MSVCGPRSLVADLLGRHVAGGADREAGTGVKQRAAGFGQRRVGRHRRRAVGDRLGEPEVEQLGLVSGGEEHVGRLQIAVDDVAGVGRAQGIGNLNADLHHALRAQRAVGHHFAQAAALEQLHHHERTAAGLADVVDGADVGVIERRGGLRLPPEALERLGVEGPIVAEELEGDLPLQPDIFGLVDHPHATAAQRAEDGVMGNRLTDHGADPIPPDGSAGVWKKHGPATHV